MGTVKQLLRLDDRPLLQHVIDNVLDSKVTETSTAQRRKKPRVWQPGQETGEGN